jgi:hypothetical protein
MVLAVFAYNLWVLFQRNLGCLERVTAASLRIRPARLVGSSAAAAAAPRSASRYRLPNATGGDRFSKNF